MRAWFRLAEIRGETVEATKETTTEFEFRQWCQYFAREPSVGDRLDWWCSQLLAAAINPYRPKGRSAVRADSLTPKRWPVPKQSGDQVAEQVLAWARGMSRRG